MKKVFEYKKIIEKPELKYKKSFSKMRKISIQKLNFL